MGERLSGGRTSGRRRAHPGGAVTGYRQVGGETGLEALIAAAVRQDVIDAEAEQRAVAAFRAARDAGAHRAATRRRDDWRPRGTGARRSVRAALSVLVAGLTLGGVAYATIGAGGSWGDAADGDRGARRPQPGTSAPERPAGAASSASPASSAPSAPRGATASARPGHPDTAQDAEARCRAYAQVRGRGPAMDATAWQRLVAAAGGADRVAGYCARQTHAPTAPAAPPTGAGRAAEDTDRSPADGGAAGAADGAGGGKGSGGEAGKGRTPTAAPTSRGRN
jgi:hypothetical protein